MPTPSLKHSNAALTAATDADADVEVDVDANAHRLPAGVIPYDYPETMLDRVEIDADGQRLRAWFVVRDDLCQGRSIGQPILPGSRLGDCLYLAFSILIAQSPRVEERVRAGMIGVRALDRTFRYRRPMRPGQEVTLDIMLLRARGRTFVASGRASEGDEVVFDADELWITLVPPTYRAGA